MIVSNKYFLADSELSNYRHRTSVRRWSFHSFRSSSLRCLSDKMITRQLKERRPLRFILFGFVCDVVVYGLVMIVEEILKKGVVSGFRIERSRGECLLVKFFRRRVTIKFLRL